jgi:hypothetical protein
MDCHAFLRDWSHASALRGFQSKAFGRIGGFPLLASSKGDPSQQCIYLSSGIHGDEPSGPQALLGLLNEGFFDDRFHWLICPTLNPTGLEAGIRENSRGVDLNRDYCLCESDEVCSHIAWLKEQQIPQLFLSLHEDWESSGFYYYEINLRGAVSDYKNLLAAAAPYFPPEPESLIDNHKVTEPGWIHHSEHPDLPEGWPEAIYLAKMGCPISLTFETPSSMTFQKRVGCHQAMVRESIRHCLL